MHWLLPWWTYPAAYCFLTGAACGWPVGYVHRGLIEWGRKYGRLLAWRRRYRGRGPLGWVLLSEINTASFSSLMRNPLGCVLRAYREVWADIAYLCATGELRARR